MFTKRVRIFAADSNPAVDKPLFKLSAARATDAFERGDVSYLDESSAMVKLRAGETADERKLMGAGTMREAWKVLPSGGCFVWQMFKDEQPQTA